MSRYDDGFDFRGSDENETDEDYYKMYKRMLEEQQKKQGRSAPKRRDYDEDIDINSFSRRPAQKKRAAGKKGKKKKGKLKKKTIIILTCILLIFGILLYFAWPFLNYNYHKLKGDADLGFSDIIDKRVVNIALFGLDTREEGDFTGRSDSIMILSINTETKKVKVISLMRDTITRMEENGEVYYSKLNNAYANGGPELAIKTLNQNYGLDISRYATINFFGMVDIIDAVGGIEATITEDELEWKGYDNPNLNNCMEEICEARGLDIDDYWISSPGKQHLNGVQAVAYARIRHCLSTFGTNDDFGRTDRQRHVMHELFSKATTMKKSQYAKLAKALLPCSETSLTYSDILSLAVNVLLKNPTFEQYRIPQTEWLMPFGYSEYGSCVYFDRDYAKRAVHAIIYEDMTLEQFTEQNPVEKNDWFASIFGPPDYTPDPITVEPETPSSQTTSESTPETPEEPTESTEQGSEGGTEDPAGNTETGTESGTETTEDGIN